VDKWPLEKFPPAAQEKFRKSFAWSLKSRLGHILETDDPSLIEKVLKLVPLANYIVRAICVRRTIFRTAVPLYYLRRSASQHDAKPDVVKPSVWGIAAAM
jgi:hypothetical protein